MPEKALKNNTNNLIEGSHLYIFLYKKAEKLASALYMVTNLISENEILRNLLREKSISIFSDIMQFQKMSFIKERLLNNSKNKIITLDTTLSDIAEIVSLLDIANVSGYISEMNFSILNREYIDLGMLIKTRREDIVSDGIRLSQDFFDVPNLYETHSLKQGILNNKNIKDNKKTENITKINKKDIHKTNLQNKNSIKDTSTNRQKESIKYPKTTNIRQSNRRSAILELLQNKPFITVKDTIDAIQGCSSKTLQRELLSLVDEGILKKEGERRWSIYRLV